MAFSGAFWIWMFAATNTAIQLRAPRPLLGRMLGLYQLSVIGPIAIGSTVAGAVAEARRDRGDARRAARRCSRLWGVWSLRNPVVEIDGRSAGQPANAAIASSVPLGHAALDL